MNNSKVSAIIPFYNGVNWLCEAVQSVLDQTYKNIEIVVVNDGSPENVHEFLEKYGSKIKYFYQENKGSAAARNLAIENATGEYYALLDSDDIWLPEKTEQQIHFMEETGVMWSHTGFYYWWPETGIIKTKDIHNNYGWVMARLYVSLRISTPSVIINARCFREHPEINFPEHMRYAQDSGCFTQLARYYPLGLLDRRLMKIRMRGTNTNSRALIRIQVNTRTYNSIKQSDHAAGIPRTAISILGIYKFNGKITDLLLNNCRLSQNIVEKIAKCLWVLPYTLERIYSKWQIYKSSKKQGIRNYYKE